ncbi:FkbM family methyltransferase [Rhodopseudomonas palustris]|nr:FkbM family methyltransferase [Rhodopseudomonas palustris]
MKKRIVSAIRKAVGFPRLVSQLESVEQELSRLARTLDAPKQPIDPNLHCNSALFQLELAADYREFNLWERPIQIVVRDCVEADSTILDIGGNVGGLATAFSKLVPLGRVFTFEPNPEMWPILYGTLKINEAENVTIVPAACFTSNLKLERFYSEQSTYKAGSRLGRKIPGARHFDVITLSVDDFCSTNDLTPAVIKIDVEGAEIAVLRASEAIISRYRPKIVFEYQSENSPGPDNPLTFLAERGYDFYDVNSYERVTADFYSGLPSHPTVNVFAIPSESELGGTYSKLRKELLHRENVSSTEATKNGVVKLEKGRYIVDVDFDMPDNDIGGLGVRIDGERRAYYSTNGRHLREHCNSNLVIEVEQAADVFVELENYTSPSACNLKSMKIYRIELGTRRA